MKNAKPKDIARMVRNESDADDVLLEQDGFEIRFACEDLADAEELARLINKASWVDINPHSTSARRMVEKYFEWLSSPEGQAAKEASDRRLKDAEAMLAKGRNIPWEKFHEPFDSVTSSR